MAIGPRKKTMSLVGEFMAIASKGNVIDQMGGHTGGPRSA